MYSRLVICLLSVMTAYAEVRVWAQDNPPVNAPQPPSLENLPRLLPPPVPPPPPQLTPPSTPPPSTPPETSATSKLPLIAGRPYEEALAVLKRHEPKLINLPGADGVSMDSEGIIVYTDNPTAVPAGVEGLPVRAAPALGWKREESVPKPEETEEPFPESPVPQAPPIAEIPYREAEVIFARHREELMRVPGVQGVILGTDGIDVYTTNPAALPAVVEGLPIKPMPSLPLLPPPPGVIVLRSGGVREQADTCPKGLKEHVSLGGWRFCVDPGYSEPIPPLMVPPIAGIPYEEALKILERHREELMKFSGVESVGLDAEGIHVEAKTPPEGFPTTVEGLPVRVEPPVGGPLRGANHTDNIRVRPLHGAVAGSDDISPQNGGTLTTVGLFRGAPRLIFPSHLLVTCSVGGPPQQLCPVGTSLSNCTPYGGTEKFRQPRQTVPQVVGFMQRWDVLQTGVNTTDSALGFMDTNTVERDGSLFADRQLEVWGLFSGAEASPAINTPVTVVTSDILNTGAHLKTATVTAIGQTENVGFGCRGPGSPPVPLISQMRLQATGNVCFMGGDSGSPVLNAAGEIIGTFNWINTGILCPGGQTFSRGGGTSASTVKQVLGFDTWYGTNTTDLSVQVHPSFRTVVQGQGACAWAYIKNTGTVTAQNVAIQNVTSFSPQPSFDYLNPAGAWNTPYSIPAGQTAQFAVCMTLNQPQIPINWIFNFYGTNAAAPVIKAAYDTFATRWTSTPLPDPIVWTATLSNDDVVHTNGPSGTGLFTVTTWNNGATGNVTITLDTDWGYGGLPYTLWVCETNAQSQCISSLSPSLSLPMTAGSVHYFLVLAQGQGQPVTLDPYYHRVFFRIREGNNPTGTLVGGAGLSITTN